MDRTFALVEGRARKQHVALHFAHPTTPVLIEADADWPLVFAGKTFKTLKARALWDHASDEELRRTYARRGKARASTFTWEGTARTTLAAYDSAAERADVVLRRP